MNPARPHSNMEIFALCVKCGIAPAASSSPSNSSRPPQTAPPNAFAARGRHQRPRRASLHKLASVCDESRLSPFRIDKHERTVQAMRTTVGGALHAAQIDGDPIPRRRRTKFIKMSRLRLNRLGRVLGEDRLLEGGVKSRTVGRVPARMDNREPAPRRTPPGRNLAVQPVRHKSSLLQASPRDPARLAQSARAQPSEKSLPSINICCARP